MDFSNFKAKAFINKNSIRVVGEDGRSFTITDKEEAEFVLSDWFNWTFNMAKFADLKSSSAVIMKIDFDNTMFGLINQGAAKEN